MNAAFCYSLGLSLMILPWQEAAQARLSGSFPDKPLMPHYTDAEKHIRGYHLQPLGTEEDIKRCADRASEGTFVRFRKAVTAAGRFEFPTCMPP